MGVVVREAEYDDIDWIVSELRYFSDRVSDKHILFSDYFHVKDLVISMINEHIFFVSENDGVKSGFIAGFVIPHLFNPDIKTLVETFWWVSEPYRYSRAGLALFKEYVEWGKVNGINLITMSLESKTEVNEKTLVRHGFKLKDRNFFMECV